MRDRLEEACYNKKSWSQGGLNVPDITNRLLKLYPEHTNDILSASSRAVLEILCTKLLDNGKQNIPPIQNSISKDIIKKPKTPKKTIPISNNLPPQIKQTTSTSFRTNTTGTATATATGIPELDQLIRELESKGYKIGALIGKGASGQVYNAYKDSAEVIIKFIPIAKRRSVIAEQWIPTYLKQLKELCRLDITCLLDFAVNDKYYAFVNKYMPGYPLNKIDMSTLSFSQKMSIALQMSNAIQFMHDNGVVHRDIKPGNTMVHINPDDSVQTGIIDMDMACISTDELRQFTYDKPTDLSILNCYHTGGTPVYFPPELIPFLLKDTPRDKIRGINQFATDIYSLGITLYYIFKNNTNPYPDCKTRDCIYDMKSTMDSANPNTGNKRLDKLIQSMTLKKPSMRPDIDNVVNELSSI